MYDIMIDNAFPPPPLQRLSEVIGGGVIGRGHREGS